MSRSSLWQNTVDWVWILHQAKRSFDFWHSGHTVVPLHAQNKGQTVVKLTVGGFGGRVWRSGPLVPADKAYKVGLQIENNVQEFTVRSILPHCAHWKSHWKPTRTLKCFEWNVDTLNLPVDLKCIPKICSDIYVSLQLLYPKINSISHDSLHELWKLLLLKG